MVVVEEEVLVVVVVVVDSSSSSNLEERGEGYIEYTTLFPHLPPIKKVAVLVQPALPRACIVVVGCGCGCGCGYG